jgi:N-acetylneuraminate synthase
LRAARDIKSGETFTRELIDVLRPAAPGAIKPNKIDLVVGTIAARDIAFGEHIRWTDLVD